MKEIREVYETSVDGFINVVTLGMIYRYEGIALCPKYVRDWMKRNPDKVKVSDSTEMFDD